MRRGRSTVVFVEAVLAVAVTGIAFGTPVGYTVAGVAAVAGIAGVVRRRGRGLADVAAGRLGDPAAPADLTGLHVVDVPTRDGELGVAGDGQGFVVVLDAGSPPAWPLADVLDLAFGDPARPAAVQVLVEQWGLAGAGVDPRFGPARTYRSLPVHGFPLWNRVLLVVRHEPAWAPETVEARGGGATGARNALAAVAARATAGRTAPGSGCARSARTSWRRCCASWAPHRTSLRPPTSSWGCRWAATTPSVRCCAPWRAWT